MVFSEAQKHKIYGLFGHYAWLQYYTHDVPFNDEHLH